MNEIKSILSVKVVAVDDGQKWSFAQDPDELHYKTYVHLPGINDLATFYFTKKYAPGQDVSFYLKNQVLYSKDKDGKFTPKRVYYLAAVQEV